jgi:Tfp pilus assembly protein PilF
MGSPVVSFLRYWVDNTVDSALPANSGFRPLLFLNHLLCWQVAGGATWPFHVVKLFMHWGTALAVTAIWRRIWASPAFRGDGSIQTSDAWLPVLAGVLFAVHPVTSECVQYISASSTLQCTLLYLWAFWAHLASADGSKRRRRTMAIAFYAGAVLTKEEGMTLPALVLVYEVIQALGSGKSLPKALVQSVKATAYLWATAAVLAGIIGYRKTMEAGGSLGTIPASEYFMTQWRAYLFYMRLWFWPFDLNADNLAFGFSHSLSELAVQQALAGNLLILGAALVNLRRWPSLAFGVAWFYITVSPASSIFVLAEPVNDRRHFLPLAGFGAALLPVVRHGVDLALGVAKSAVASRRRSVAFLLIALLLGFGSAQRSQVWATEETLWRDTLEKNPDSGRAMNNLALIHMGRGEMTQALELLDRCVKAWPYYSYCYVNKAISHAFRKEDEPARAAYQKAVELNSNEPSTHIFFGEFLESRGDYAGARTQFEAVHRQVRGTSLPAALGLARVYAHDGDLNEARRVLDSLNALYPGNPKVLEAMRKLNPPGK